MAIVPCKFKTLEVQKTVIMNPLCLYPRISEAFGNNGPGNELAVDPTAPVPVVALKSVF